MGDFRRRPERAALRYQPKRVGLVVRVSTDRQAANDEGSLKTQLQRLRAHLDYKQASGEHWTEVAVYELRASSINRTIAGGGGSYRASAVRERLPCALPSPTVRERVLPASGC